MCELITVIIPAYNVGKYIENTLRSVTEQSWKHLQIIIVDDGSDDGTWDICEKAAALDNRIVLLKKENGGVSSARNAALPYIRGDYVTFVDADDELYRDCLKKMANALKNQHADAAQCVIEIDGQPPMKCGDRSFEDNRILRETLTLGMITTYLCGKLWRRECVEGLRFDESLTTGEDFIFAYQAMKRCRRFTTLSDVGYHYIWRDEACTKAAPQPTFILTLDAFERLSKEENDKLLYEAWRVYLSSFASFLLTRTVRSDSYPEWYPRLRRAAIDGMWKRHAGYRTPFRRKLQLILLTFCPRFYYALLRRS